MATATPDNPAPREVEVPGAPAISVRVRDGRGTPIVLLHGLGSTLEDWEPLTRSLRRSRPVLAADMRGHGRSADGACSLDGIVDDLTRVIRHFGLRRPVIVGHDLGAMAATVLGTRREDLTAVVEINGLGWPRAETVAAQLGTSPEDERDHVTAVRRFITEQLSETFAPMPREVFERLMDGMRSGPRGLPGDVLTASARRAATVDGDVVAPRPGPRTVRALCAAIDEFDPERVRHQLRVPTLALVSTGPPPPWPGAPRRLGDVLTAHARHQVSSRAAMATARGVEAPFRMHLSHPATVATVVEDFLAAL